MHISDLAANNAVAKHILDTVRGQGYVKLMMSGDSHGTDGADSNGGVRMSIAMLLTMMGVPVTFVGDNALSAAANRFMYNSFGGVLNCQCQGGITTAQLLTGTTTLTRGWAAAVAYHKPDIVFMSMSSNDSTGYQKTYRDVIDGVAAYSTKVPLIWLAAPDSNSATVEYYNIDTGRATKKELIRLALADLTLPGRGILVDSCQALGMFAPYPIDTDAAVPASTDTGAETVTFTYDPGWFTGTEVVPSATGGGLTAGTTYWVNRSASKTYTFHTTRANAMAGSSAVNLTASITASLTPNGAMYAQNNNANGLFYDGTHLNVTGYALWGALAVSQALGADLTELLRMIQTVQPYAPRTRAWANDIAAAGSAVLFPGGNRRIKVTSITVENPHATTEAQATLLKRRVSLDGSTVALEATVYEAMDVKAGTTRGFHLDPPLVCHYNEGVKVAIAGADCNVVAHVEKVIA